MNINIYKNEDHHEEMILGLIKSEGFLESCKHNIMQYATNNDIEGLKSTVEHMWQQELGNFRIVTLIEQLKKGNLEERVKQWVCFYKIYWMLGFTPYII